MRIVRLHVEGFGIWTNLILEDLSPGLTVIYGPNEAGKTTLMQFVRTVFYGFSDERKRRFWPPVHGGNGGSIYLRTMSGDYCLVRRGPETSDGHDRGAVKLLGSDGQARGSIAVTQLLGHVDEPIYANVFSVGLAELQALATLHESRAADELYKLSSGVDRVSLIEILRQVQQHCYHWLSPDGRSGAWVDLVSRRDGIASQCDGATRSTRQYLELVAQQSQLQQRIRECQQRFESALKEHQRITIAQQIEPLWLERLAIAAKKDPLAAHPEISEEAAIACDRLNRLLDRCQKKLEETARSIETLQASLGKLTGQPRVWQARHRLAALREQVAEQEAMASRLFHVRNEMERWETELHRISNQLGISPQPVGGQRVLPNQKTLQAIQGPAKSLRAAQRHWKLAKQRKDELAKEVQQLEQAWRQALARCGVQRVDTAREQHTGLLKKLQQLQELESQIAKRERERKQLEQECLERLKTPLMPLKHILAWGGMVALGVTLILIALFSQWVGDLRVPLILFGLLSTGSGFLLQQAYQQVHSKELHEQRRQLARMQRQWDELIERKRELEQNTSSSGPLDKQLQEVQSRLRELDQLGPLETQLHAAQNLLAESETQVHQREREYREAQDRWQAALRKLQLSETLTPGQVRRLVTLYERLVVIQERYNDCRNLHEQLHSRIEQVNQSAAAMLNDLGLRGDQQDIRQQLQQFEEAIAAERQLRATRNQLVRQRRQLARRMSHIRHRMEQLRLRRQAIFSRFGVTDVDQFQRVVNASRTRRELQRQLDDLDQRILAILAGRSKLEEIVPLLEAKEQLSERCKQLEQQRTTLEQEYAELQQTLGRTAQQLETLSTDDTLDRLRLRLAVAEERMVHARRACRRLALTAAFLEQLRRKYENEHQPEALRRASQFLSLITAGRYVRLWAPLGKPILRVDDASGQTLDLELLSQGTREAIFLSLRLALAVAYARNGLTLPMILDDVLVNFDKERAEGAARALRQVADSGIQVLVFTCHEHIAACLQAVGADLRQLPATAKPGLSLSSQTHTSSCAPETAGPIDLIGTSQQADQAQSGKDGEPTLTDLLISQHGDNVSTTHDAPETMDSTPLPSPETQSVREPAAQDDKGLTSAPGAANDIEASPNGDRFLLEQPNQEIPTGSHTESADGLPAVTGTPKKARRKKRRASGRTEALRDHDWVAQIQSPPDAASQLGVDNSESADRTQLPSAVEVPAAWWIAGP